MSDFAIALARMQLTLDQSDHLQTSLRRRQDDLLSLEESISEVAAGRMGALVLIDRSEDVQRAVKSHADLEVRDARDGLTHARGALIDGLVERAVRPETGRVLLHVVDRALREGARGTAALEEAATALQATSQAGAGQPNLLEVARWSVDAAAGHLESARRAVFRVVEDLPVLVDSIRNVAVEAGFSSDHNPAVRGDALPRQLSGAELDRRHLPSPAAGIETSPVWR